MEIKRSGTRPVNKGPDEYFTGNAKVEPLFQATAPGRVLGALVTFEPGARTAWHTHPLGQNLIVTAGTGWQVRIFLKQEFAGATRPNVIPAPDAL